jgi:hypothetical protein
MRLLAASRGWEAGAGCLDSVGSRFYIAPRIHYRSTLRPKMSEIDFVEDPMRMQKLLVRANRTCRSSLTGPSMASASCVQDDNMSTRLSRHPPNVVKTHVSWSYLAVMPPT